MWRAVKIDSSLSELCLVNTASQVSLARRQWFSYQMEWHLNKCTTFEEFMRRVPGAMMRPVDCQPEIGPVHGPSNLGRSI
jgi:hypothetical protein